MVTLDFLHTVFGWSFFFFLVKKILYVYINFRHLQSEFEANQ